jgi:hypothetical protein
MTRSNLFFSFVLLIIGLAVVCQRCHGKCPVFPIVIEGRLQSSQQGDEIVVRVHAKHGKPLAEQTAALQSNTFLIEVPFSTFVSAGWFGSHDCSREPDQIEVILRRGETSLQTVELSIARDFDWDAKREEWRTKIPVSLGQPSPPK